MGALTAKPTILLIDDDPAIREMVRDLFQRNHLRADVVGSTADADRALESARFGLVTLDVLMPGEDGTAFCRRLRERSSIPFRMLSALGKDIGRTDGMTGVPARAGRARAPGGSVTVAMLRALRGAPENCRPGAHRSHALPVRAGNARCCLRRNQPALDARLRREGSSGPPPRALIR